MPFLVPIRPSCALSDPVLVSVPVSILVPVQISATALVSIPAPVPIFILCSLTGLHVRLRSHFHPMFFDGSTRSSPFPFPPRPRSRSRPIPGPAPVAIWRSFVRLHLSSRSRSGYAPIIGHVPVAGFDPAPASDPASDPVCSLPFLGPGYPLGTMRVYRPRFFCVRVCACVYLVSHNHSYLSLQGGINDTFYEMIATKRTHSLYNYISYISPECLALRSLLPCYFLYYLGWQLLNQYFRVLFFSASAQVSPVFRITSNSFRFPCAYSPLLHSPLSCSPLSFSFPSYVISLPSTPALVPASSPSPSTSRSRSRPRPRPRSRLRFRPRILSRS